MSSDSPGTDGRGAGGVRRPAADAPPRIAERWRRFAREATGRSPAYVEICDAVADSPFVLDFLAAMPEAKWQPNVLLGVVRYLYGTPSSGREFVALVERHVGDIAEEMAARSTQTNEPARCATLMPVLARLPQPLALLEVGAAAGLCLLPDYYGYDYGEHAVHPSASCAVEPPRFHCRAGRGTPLPERGVEVAWRAGLDLHPVDLGDDADVRWLEALMYVRDRAEREAFARTVVGTGAVWIANEAPSLLPGIPDLGGEHPDPAACLLCVDAAPTAWTDGHGTWIDWRPEAVQDPRRGPGTA